MTSWPSPVRTVEQVIGEKLRRLPLCDDPHAKNPAAVALGRLGGLKGGKARAKKFSPRKRHQIAKKARKVEVGHKEAAIRPCFLRLSMEAC